jgi:hypothetical protein
MPTPQTKLVVHSETMRNMEKSLREISLDTMEVLNECVNTGCGLIKPKVSHIM